MIGSPAYYTRSEPGKLIARVDGVRLTGKFPAAEAGREVAEVPGRGTEVALAAGADAAMRDLVRPHVFLEIFRRVERGAGFEQCHRNALVGENFGDGATAGAGSDDDDVVDLGASADLKHSILIVAAAEGVGGWPARPGVHTSVNAARRVPALLGLGKLSSSTGTLSPCFFERIAFGDKAGQGGTCHNEASFFGRLEQNGVAVIHHCDELFLNHAFSGSSATTTTPNRRPMEEVSDGRMSYFTSVSGLANFSSATGTLFFTSAI
jgi:hypothetical protein